MLPCGHAICSVCVATKPNAPCPRCPTESKSNDDEEQEPSSEIKPNLPYNVYVAGLVHTIICKPAAYVQEPDMSFHTAPTDGSPFEGFYF